jgi:hypothetical protein
LLVGVLVGTFTYAPAGLLTARPTLKGDPETMIPAAIKPVAVAARSTSARCRSLAARLRSLAILESTARQQAMRGRAADRSARAVAAAAQHGPAGRLRSADATGRRAHAALL